MASLQKEDEQKQNFSCIKKIFFINQKFIFYA